VNGFDVYYVVESIWDSGQWPKCWILENTFQEIVPRV